MARKILLIDDDPDALLAMKLPLEREGYEVHEATNGEEGLAQAKTLCPDLIILDVMMEAHTAGFQLAQELHGPDAPEQLRLHHHVEDEQVRAEGFRSEEHTSELQSRENLVCRLLPE